MNRVSRVGLLLMATAVGGAAGCAHSSTLSLSHTASRSVSHRVSLGPGCGIPRPDISANGSTASGTTLTESGEKPTFSGAVGQALDIQADFGSPGPDPVTSARLIVAKPDTQGESGFRDPHASGPTLDDQSTHLAENSASGEADGVHSIDVSFTPQHPGTYPVFVEETVVGRGPCSVGSNGGGVAENVTALVDVAQ